MTDGMPLPWPFPGSLPNPVSSLSSVRTMGLSGGETAPVSTVHDQPFTDAVMEEAQKLAQKFGKSLPQAKSVEIYLIQALSEPSIQPMAAGNDGFVVIFPPEFLFVLDLGLEHRVGGSVIWEAPGQYGDPKFPWKKTIAVRSVRELTYRGLVYPAIAGSLMIGIVEGAAFPDVVQKLTDFGLQDIQGSGFFATASCAPFEEATICRNLEAKFDFVKYAEMNSVVRINDFSPGWSLVRLA